MRPACQSHSRLDEDDEVIIMCSQSGAATKLFSAEEPIADQEMVNEVLGFEMLPTASEECAEEGTEELNEESTAEIEIRNLPVVPVTSLEESNQDESVIHEVVLAPHEPIIRTSGMSEQIIKEEGIKDSEPAPPAITEDYVTAEEPIRESPKESASCESAEHSVVNNKPISELPVSNSDAVSQELKHKSGDMEISGKYS